MNELIKSSVVIDISKEYMELIKSIKDKGGDLNKLSVKANYDHSTHSYLLTMEAVKLE